MVEKNGLEKHSHPREPQVDQPGDFLLDIDSGCAHRALSDVALPSRRECDTAAPTSPFLGKAV